MPQSLLEQEAGFVAEMSSESVRIRHVFLAPFHVVFDCKSKSGCTHGEKCRFRHVEVDGQPSKTSKKSCVKGSVAFFKGVYTGGVVCLKTLIQ